MAKQEEALRLLDEALKELESAKGSVLSSVQKLSRASGLVGDEDVQTWCAVQLGDPKFTAPLEKLVLAVTAAHSDRKSKSTGEALTKAIAEVMALNLKHNVHYSDEELTVKAAESGGGYVSIGFVEERYADLVRTKRGNDGTYYKHNLYSHLNYVRTKAHELASSLYNQLKFAGTTASCFDVLRNAVDDRMLDLDPSLAEQLMLAFRGVSSSNEEEWSQALTTCRRLLERLADALHPATDDASTSRPLGQSQYVNRLWAFMDGAIESETNRDLAKAHIDFLGAWLEKVNKLSNKGVHGEVTQLEAVKTVFHVYLMLADLLDYLGAVPASQEKPDINTATIDELEALLNVNRSVAKEIVKARVQQGSLDKQALSMVRGIGPKTLQKAVDAFAL